MKGKRITPERGKIYKNRGGGEYLCIRGLDGDAIMRNVASGWMFWANGVTQYEDGSIEWDYSTDGHWEEKTSHCTEGRQGKLRLNMEVSIDEEGLFAHMDRTVDAIRTLEDEMTGLRDALWKASGREKGESEESQEE